MSDRSDVVSLDDCLVRVVDRERVAAVQEAMPPAQDVEQVADVFALLGDPNRLRLRRASPLQSVTPRSGISGTARSRRS